MGKNLIRKEKGAKNWTLENIGIKELINSEKPTETTEECSERSERMTLRESI